MQEPDEKFSFSWCKRIGLRLDPAHIVYGDEEQVICWLWNHKDSQATCIDKKTTHAIFFVDAATKPVHWDMQKTVDFLSELLEKIGSKSY